MFDTGSKYQQLGKIDNLISADSWFKLTEIIKNSSKL